MKKIEIITADEKLYKINELLRKHNVGGLTVYDIKGRGRAKLEPVTVGRGVSRTTPEFGNRTKIEVVVSDTIYKDIIKDILETTSTGSASDGKIWVIDVLESYDIGTKQTGEDAL